MPGLPIEPNWLPSQETIDGATIDPALPNAPARTSLPANSTPLGATRLWSEGSGIPIQLASRGSVTRLRVTIAERPPASGVGADAGSAQSGRNGRTRGGEADATQAMRHGRAARASAPAVGMERRRMTHLLRAVTGEGSRMAASRRDRAWGCAQEFYSPHAPGSSEKWGSCISREQVVPSGRDGGRGRAGSGGGGVAPGGGGGGGGRGGPPGGRGTRHARPATPPAPWPRRGPTPARCRPPARPSGSRPRSSPPATAAIGPRARRA